MRKFFSYTLYASILLVYCFLTLPLLLPNNFGEVGINQFDVIIVLGGGVNPDCTLDPSMQSRMDTAIKFFHQEKASTIILSGGPQDIRGRCVESEAMRQYALSQNIPEKFLIKESLALNTYQNAFHTVSLMNGMDMKSALIVTSDYHAKRTNLVFSQYEIDYQLVTAISKTVGNKKYKELLKEQVLLCFHTVFGIPNRFGLDLKEQKLAAVLKSLASI